MRDVVTKWRLLSLAWRKPRIRADSRLVPSQSETSLQSNAASHWLDTYLESALYSVYVQGWVDLLTDRCDWSCQYQFSKLSQSAMPNNWDTDSVFPNWTTGSVLQEVVITYACQTWDNLAILISSKEFMWAGAQHQPRRSQISWYEGIQLIISIGLHLSTSIFDPIVRRFDTH